MSGSRYRANLRALYLYAALGYAGFQRGIFILLLVERGFSKAQIGTLESSLFWANVLSEVPAGLLGDRHGRKLSVIVGLLLLVINAVATLYCRHYVPFLLLFLLEGIGLAFISGSDLALLYETLRRAGRSGDYVRVASRFRLVAYLSHGLTIAIGGVLLHWSWTWVYGSVAAAWLLAVVALMPLRDGDVAAGARAGANDAEASTADEAEDAPISMQLWRFFFTGAGRELFGLIAALALFDAALTPYFVYSPLLFTSYGLGATSIGLLNGAIDLLAAIPLLLAARMALRPDRTIVLTMFGTGIVIALNLIRWLPSALVIYVVAMVGPIVMQALVDNLIQQRVPSAIRASASSCVSLAESVAVGIAYFVYGVLMDHVPVYLALSFGAVPTLAAAALALSHFSKARARTTPVPAAAVAS